MLNWRKSRLSVCLWLAAIGWCALLFFFSGQSGAESGLLSQKLTAFVLRLLPWLPWDALTLEIILRKCAHFGIFAIEGALLSGALLTSMRHQRRAFVLSVLCCSALAGLNELHQSFIIDRSCELRDVFIDSAGAFTGALFTAILLALFSRSYRKAP